MEALKLLTDDQSRSHHITTRKHKIDTHIHTYILWVVNLLCVVCAARACLPVESILAAVMSNSRLQHEELFSNVVALVRDHLVRCRTQSEEEKVCDVSTVCLRVAI